MVRKPSLEERRDTLLDLMWREKGEDLRERRRMRLRQMGFSERAIREKDGVIAAYLEQRSPHFHGLIPPFSERKAGKKRRGKAPARRNGSFAFGSDTTPREDS